MNTKIYSSFFRLSRLKKAAIALCLAAAPLLGHAQCFPNWSYAMPMYITNNTANALDTFQVPIYVNTQDLVTAGHMNADGSDIRFVTSDFCCNALSFHIDSGMNSTTTKIWVKVWHINASGNDTIQMLYGNPAAATASDPVATYDMWEPFDNQTNHFSSVCNDGSGVMSVSGGLGTFSWGSDAIWESDSIFSLNHVYTADGMVTAITGAWPGFYWQLDDGGSNNHYSLLYGYSSIRIGVASYSAGFCQGENWASAVETATGTGYWSFTWVATGDQESIAADYGPLNATDNLVSKTSPLRFCLGGIEGSTGSYTLDWVRVRKYAAVMPTAIAGTEAPRTDTIVYASPFCKAADSTATVVNNGPMGGTYTIAPAGGVINATSGVIDLGASAAGTYTVTYTATVGACNYVATGTAVINAATVPTVTAAGHVLTATGTYATYQWYRNSAIVAGATTNPYTATQGGTYYVVVTDTNGCTAQSANIVISNVGVANVASIVDNVSVYPNPNNGLFTIDGTAKADDNKATIEVTDVTGKVLMTTDTKIVNNAIHQEIQLNGKIPAGVYMLRITAGTEKKTVRLNVQ